MNMENYDEEELKEKKKGLLLQVVPKKKLLHPFVCNPSVKLHSCDVAWWSYSLALSGTSGKVHHFPSSKLVGQYIANNS